ncbi:hypothetical protein BDZ89DRAFT_1113891 [Hymenopellis radicata]|nr:hypothetical protein BDZ89DRAFT_1113891 [Hymenopellis radicata]
MEAAEKLPLDRVHIFTNGSVFKAGVGAAAWSGNIPLTAPNGEVVRRLYLGRESDHTVFEAELVGLLLALDIIENTPRLTKATILFDSQAAIMAIRNGSTGGGGRYLVEEFETAISKPAAIAKFVKQTRATWAEEWNLASRRVWTRRRRALSRAEASTLTQLRTSHIGLKSISNYTLITCWCCAGASTYSIDLIYSSTGCCATAGTTSARCSLIGSNQTSLFWRRKAVGKEN